MARKVLVPLDGSRLAEASLSQLAALKHLGDLEVMLVSVVDSAEEPGRLTPQEAEQREHNVLSAYLNDVQTGLQKHLSLRAEVSLLHGNPAEEILNAANTFDPDLIVLSSHGRAGVSRWRRGSVADKVIRGADPDLLVLGPKAALLAEWYAEVSPPFSSILVALDGSELAEAALPVAGELAEAFGSTLHLVRVVQLPHYGDMGADSMYPDILSDMVGAAESYLAAVQMRPGMPVDVKTKSLVGSAATELLRYIDNQQIGLVVMTTHGRGGFARAALGSVTDRLIGSSAAVLVVKPKE